MEFRDATAEADVELLAKMNRNLILDEGHRNRMNDAELKERMQSWLAAEYTAVIFSENDRSIGYALWRDDKDYIYVRQFYIQPEDRRKGYARSALQWLQQNRWGKETVIRIEVLVGNLTGIDFWRAVGFKDYCITMENKK